jgi:hypothetical protein
MTNDSGPGRVETQSRRPVEISGFSHFFGYTVLGRWAGRAAKSPNIRVISKKGHAGMAIAKTHRRRGTSSLVFGILSVLHNKKGDYHRRAQHFV